MTDFPFLTVLHIMDNIVQILKSIFVKLKIIKNEDN